MMAFLMVRIIMVRHGAGFWRMKDKLELYACLRMMSMEVGKGVDKRKKNIQQYTAGNTNFMSHEIRQFTFS